MAIEVGQEAPDFTLKDTENRDVTLSSFRGDKNVVLVFYPFAFSSVCTRQLTEIGEHEGRYAEGDAQVIGVSVDSRYAQRRFAEELGLRDAILLADFEPKGAVSRSYGVFLEELGFSGRATFVIDKAGVVRGVSLTDTPAEMPDEAEYFQALATCDA
ncbi:MAG TPA: redoxin domain-containing protein [Miltoncostaeaceae bacterium]|jgi:peroxiredoxin|nr:redoxin domain-containing protein [Miltoncostaeaceae bacterium]